MYKYITYNMEHTIQNREHTQHNNTITALKWQKVELKFAYANQEAIQFPTKITSLHNFLSADFIAGVFSLRSKFAEEDSVYLSCQRNINSLLEHQISRDCKDDRIGISSSIIFFTLICGPFQRNRDESIEIEIFTFCVYQHYLKRFHIHLASFFLRSKCLRCSILEQGGNCSN